MCSKLKKRMTKDSVFAAHHGGWVVIELRALVMGHHYLGACHLRAIVVFEQLVIQAWL